MAGLGKIPVGLTNDEANIGYDAYSILKTGKDQWGKSQPSTYLTGFGDFRPPVYTYAAIPSVAFFGLNEFAVRLPSAIAGSLTILAVFFLALLLLRNVWIGILSMFFLAFNPWHTAMSRIGIESTLAVFIITLALVLFLLGLQRKVWLYPAMVLFGLSLYTYTSYVVLTPLLVALLCFLYRKQLFADRKTLSIALLLFIIALLPMFFEGSLRTASVRSRQVNLTSDIGIINNVNDKRGECQVDFQSKVCQLFQNKYAAFVSVLVSNYLNHFSPELLVSRGTPTQYSVLPERGLLYATEYIFFFTGVFFLLRKKQTEALFVLLWIFLSPIPDSITSSGHYSRYLPVLPALQVTSAVGAYEFLLFVAKKRWLFIPFILIPFYEIIAFLLVYWSYFPRFYSTFSHYGYRDLMEYVYKNVNNYDRIIISSRFNDTKQYVFYLFYTRYDPSNYQSGKNIEKVLEGDSWIRIKRINNIYFVPALTIPSKDAKKPYPHTLLAGAPVEFPKTSKKIKEVKDKKNNVLFLLVDVNANPVLTEKK